MNQTLISFGFVVATSQVLLGLVGLLAGRRQRQPVVLWFSLLMVLMGLVGLLDVASISQPAWLPALARLYAVLTPMMPYAFVGGVIALLDPAAMQRDGKGQRWLIGFAALTLAVTALDTFLSTGVYFNPAPGPAPKMADFLDARINILPFVIATWLGPLVALLVGLARRWNVTARAAQAALVITLLASMATRIAFSSVAARGSTEVLANLVISAGLVLLLANNFPFLLNHFTDIGRNWRIATKLVRAFGAAVTLTVALGLMSVFALSYLNNRVQHTLSTQNRLARASAQLLNTFRAAQRDERDFGLQARTVGLTAARTLARYHWRTSMDEMGTVIDSLRRDPNLSPTQGDTARRIDLLHEQYRQQAEQYFTIYEERGDRATGAISHWMTTSEAVDTLVQQNSIADPAFLSQLLALRNQQLFYLATENDNVGRRVRALYDELGEAVRDQRVEAPLATRRAVQAQLQLEAAAFEGISQTTDEVDNVATTLEETSFDLNEAISALEQGTARDFDAGVEAVEQTRFTATILILGGLASAVVLTSLLANVVARQITRPVLALAAAAGEIASGRQGIRAEVLSQDEIGQAAVAFNTMAARVEGLLFTLEERVARRTAQLETAAQVAASVNAMHELQGLLDATTELLVTRFEDIYHAQVFLLRGEGAERWATLRASTGEVGRQLLAREHSLQVGSHSVIGQVTETGQHVLARVFDPYSVFRPNDLLPNTKSELALPIRRAGVVIGALDVQSQRPYAFSEDDVAVLQTLADQLAVAVENARLFRTLNLSIAEVERLFNASNRLVSAGDADEVLDSLVAVAAGLPALDRFSILLFEERDADGRPLGARTVRSWDREAGAGTRGQTFDLSAAITNLWTIILEQGFLELPDVSAYQIGDQGIKGNLDRAGIVSLAVLTLEAAGQPLGILVLQRREVGAFPEEIVRTFRVLAQQAAIALNRFGLLEQLSARVETLQRLRESFLHLDPALEGERLLSLLVQRAAGLMEANAGALYLYDPDKEEMVLVAAHNMDRHLLGRRLRRDEGAAGQFMRRETPFLVDNYAEWEGGSTFFPERGQYGAVAAVPLRRHETLLGALTVVNLRDQRRFNQDDLNRLTLFGDQAALTIENNRLLRETERSLRETSALYASTQELMGAASEQEMLGAIADNLALGPEDVILVVKGTPLPNPTALEIVALNDAELVLRQTPERRVRRTRDIFTIGMHLPATMLVPPNVPVPEATTRIVSSLLESGIQGATRLSENFGLHGLLSVPIYTREGFYGAILILRRGTTPFHPDELTRVTTLASQFAVAFDNILLLAETRRAANQLSAAAEVSRAASTELDVTAVLTRAINLIHEKFGHYHVQVFLVDEARQWAVLHTSTGEPGRALLARGHRLGVGSRSVIGQVTAGGHHIVARATEVDPETVHRRNELLPDTRTELALPMTVGGTIIGALDVQSLDPAAFSNPEDIAILQTLADQLSVAVQNARLFERTQASLASSQALYAASQAIARAPTLDAILAAIYEHVAPADVSDISVLAVLQDSEGDPHTLRVEAGLVSGRPELDFKGRTFPIALEQRALIHSLSLGTEVAAFHDTTTDPRLDPHTRASYHHLGQGAFLAMALAERNGQPLILQVAFPRPRPISQDEIERFGTIASQAASAIQTLTLLENMEARSTRLNATNQLASHLLGADSPEQILEVAAREIAGILGGEQVAFTFYNWDTGEGEVRAHYRQDPATHSVLGFRIPLVDNPQVSWYQRTGEPLVIADVRRAPLTEAVRAQILATGQATILGVPLKLRNTLIGSFLVGRGEATSEQPWGPADVTLAQTLATLVTSALENTRLFEQVRRSLEQTQVLYRGSRAIAEAHAMDDIAAAIGQHILGGTGAAVTLLQLELDANEMIRQVQIEGSYLPTGRPIVWHHRALADTLLPVLHQLDINREPLVVENMAQEPRLTAREKRIFERLHVGALVSVPLRLAGGWTRAIVVAFPEPRAIPGGEVDRLIAIANQAATTMQNRELLRQTQESLEESQLLYQVGRGINEAEGAEGLLRAIRTLAEPLEPDQVTLLLFDAPVLEGERPMTFRVAAEEGMRLPLLPLGTVYRLQDFPLLRRHSISSTLLYGDVLNPDVGSAEERLALREMGLRALFLLPLRVGSRFVGWLSFQSAEPRTVDNTVVRRLQVVAPQVATALQSLQLLSEAQRRAWREEQISRITARLHSTTDAEEIMRIGLQELKRTMNVKRTAAWIQPDEGSTNGNGHHSQSLVDGT